MSKSEALQYIKSHWKVSSPDRIKEMLLHYFAMPDDDVVTVGMPEVVPVKNERSALEILSAPLLENSL